MDSRPWKVVAQIADPRASNTSNGAKLLIIHTMPVGASRFSKPIAITGRACILENPFAE